RGRLSVRPRRVTPALPLRSRTDYHEAPAHPAPTRDAAGPYHPAPAHHTRAAAHAEQGAPLMQRTRHPFARGLVAACGLVLAWQPLAIAQDIAALERTFQRVAEQA